MGQQQLLLLVLATVIVGLATVAGIQAFDENQTQAAQDALVQRGTSIISDIKGAANKPEELGGIDLNPSNGNAIAPGKVLNRMGYETGGPNTDNLTGNETPVEGAPGANPTCNLNLPGDGTAAATCTSSAATQEVVVTLDVTTDPSTVSTAFN